MTEEKENIDTKDMSDQTKSSEVEDSNPDSAQTEINVTDGEIDRLNKQLESKESELKEAKDRYLRQLAELENFKKRIIREKEETLRFANETIVKDLLPVVDNLERALTHATENDGENAKALIEGVEMVLKGLLDTLARHGVSPVLAVGQPFDPAVHEAVAQIESDTVPASTVVDEYSKGYLLRERLVRPAMVSVSKGPPEQVKKNAEGEVENHPSDD